MSESAKIDESDCPANLAKHVVGQLMLGVDYQAIVDGLVGEGLSELNAHNLVDLMVLAADAACDVREQGCAIDEAIGPVLDCGVPRDLAIRLVQAAAEAISREAASFSNHAEIADLKLAWCIVDGLRQGEDKDEILRDLVDAGLLFQSMAAPLYENTMLGQQAADRILAGHSEEQVFAELGLDRRPAFVRTLARQLVLESERGESSG